MGGWVGLRNGWMCGFINVKDMYNNDVGQGRLWAYEAHQVK
jgi:hypothetical protein